MSQFVTDLLCTGMVVGLSIVFPTAASKCIKSQEIAFTAPCSLMGKHQRDPPSSKDTLSCDQPDGTERSWFLPGTPFVLYRSSGKGFIEHEDIFPTIIHPKPITPLQDSLQDSLLNPPFNFNFKFQFKFKDIDDQVQDDSKETTYPELGHPIQQATGRPKAGKSNARYNSFGGSYRSIKFESPIHAHLEHWAVCRRPLGNAAL